MSVALKSSNATVLPLPPTITVPAGATELGIIAKLSWVTMNTSLAVTATTPYGSVTSPITAVPTQMAGGLGTLLLTGTLLQTRPDDREMYRLNLLICTLDKTEYTI